MISLHVYRRHSVSIWLFLDFVFIVDLFTTQTRNTLTLLVVSIGSSKVIENIPCGAPSNLISEPITILLVIASEKMNGLIAMKPRWSRQWWIKAAKFTLIFKSSVNSILKSRPGYRCENKNKSSSCPTFVFVHVCLFYVGHNFGLFLFAYLVNIKTCHVTEANFEWFVRFFSSKVECFYQGVQSVLSF